MIATQQQLIETFATLPPEAQAKPQTSSSSCTKHVKHKYF